MMVFDAYFLSCFADVKKPHPLQHKEDVSYVMTESTEGLPRWLGGEEPTCPCRRSRRCECDPAVRKTPWRRQWQPTPAFLPGKPYKEGILVALVHEVTCKRVGHDLVTEQQLSRYLWARGHRPPGAQGLMPPRCLIISQSENCAQTNHSPCNLLPLLNLAL